MSLFEIVRLFEFILNSLKRIFDFASNIKSNKKKGRARKEGLLWNLYYVNLKSANNFCVAQSNYTKNWKP